MARGGLAHGGDLPRSSLSRWWHQAPALLPKMFLAASMSSHHESKLHC